MQKLRMELSETGKILGVVGIGLFIASCDQLEGSDRHSQQSLRSPNSSRSCLTQAECVPVSRATRILGRFSKWGVQMPSASCSEATLFDEFAFVFQGGNNG